MQQCLSTLLARPEADQHLTVLVPFLNEESAKSTIAPGSTFVLVEWCSVVVLGMAGSQELWEKWGLQVFASQSRVLEKCVASTPHSKDGRTQSALVITRRALRAVFKNKAIGIKAANDMISAMTTKGSASTAPNAIMLGVIAGVCARLQAMKSVVENHASEYYAFYVREILGSRAILSAHIADGLHDFFESFATEESVVKEIASAIEKALLRAPEVVLNDLVSPLITSLPPSVDTSEFLQKHLLKGLVANVKSTNATIRDGAKSTFESAARRSTTETSLVQISEELTKQLKDAKSADQRTIYAQMLAVLSPSHTLTPKVLSGLAPLVAKETNETALSAEVPALGSQVTYSLIQNLTLDSAISKVFIQGLSDKKPSIRRIWAIQLGQIAWSLTTEQIGQQSAGQFLESTLEKLVSSFEEVVANAVPAAQTGLVTVAYVLTAISLLKLKDVSSPKLSIIVKKAGVHKGILGTEAKPSFLTNHRVYSKLSNEDDLRWSVRAVAAAAESLADAEAAFSDNAGWSHAMFYLLTAASVHPTVKKEASRALTSVYVENPSRVARIVTKGLWLWLRNIDLEEKDTAATASKSGNNDLHLAVNAICLSKDDERRILITDATTVLSEQLRGLLVLCRRPLIARLNWIELCLHTGLDPKSIVEHNPDQWMEELIQRANVCLPFFAVMTCVLIPFLDRQQIRHPLSGGTQRCL